VPVRRANKSPRKTTYYPALIDICMEKDKVIAHNKGWVRLAATKLKLNVIAKRTPKL